MCSYTYGILGGTQCCGDQTAPCKINNEKSELYRSTIRYKILFFLIIQTQNLRNIDQDLLQSLPPTSRLPT